jgi:hypothetical protein
MDDTRNERIFKIVQNDCEWRGLGMFMGICEATGLECTVKNCAPFKISLTLIRPEIREG